MTPRRPTSWSLWICRRRSTRSTTQYSFGGWNILSESSAPLSAGLGPTYISDLASSRLALHSPLRSSETLASRKLITRAAPIFAVHHITRWRHLAYLAVRYHKYADDTQLYIAVDKATATSASTTITASTTAIYEWLLHNCLALNPDKSESVLLGTATRTGPLRDVVSVNVTGTPITLSHSIKSLGFVIDENLKFDSHVSAVCKS